MRTSSLPTYSFERDAGEILRSPDVPDSGGGIANGQGPEFFEIVLKGGTSALLQSIGLIDDQDRISDQFEIPHSK